VTSGEVLVKPTAPPLAKWPVQQFNTTACNSVQSRRYFVRFNRKRWTFSGTLQLHCKFHYWDKISSVVCRRRPSVTRVYCDKMAKDRIMQFSVKCSPMPYLFACQVWLRNSKGIPLIARGGSYWGGVVFDRGRNVISSFFIESHWQTQLITIIAYNTDKCTNKHMSSSSSSFISDTGSI